MNDLQFGGDRGAAFWVWARSNRDSPIYIGNHQTFFGELQEFSFSQYVNGIVHESLHLVLQSIGETLASPYLDFPFEKNQFISLTRYGIAHDLLIPKEQRSPVSITDMYYFTEKLGRLRVYGIVESTLKQREKWNQYHLKNRKKILARARALTDEYGNSYAFRRRIIGYDMKEGIVQSADGEYINAQTGEVIPFDMAVNPIFADVPEQELGSHRAISGLEKKQILSAGKKRAFKLNSKFANFPTRRHFNSFVPFVAGI